MNADEVYTAITTSSWMTGGPYHVAEEALYQTLTRATMQWLENIGEPVAFAVSPQQITRFERTLKDVQIELNLKLARCYQINSIDNVVEIVKEIGSNPEGKKLPWLLAYTNAQALDSCFVITPGDHYVYPLLFKGAYVDLSKYHHDYASLCHAGGAKGVSQFYVLTDRSFGDLPQKCLALANWVCESDRNWNQLSLTLLAHSNRESASDLLENKLFPMGAGGWKGQTTWGDDVDAALQQVKRLMLRMVFQYMPVPAWWKNQLTALLQALAGLPAYSAEQGVLTGKEPRPMIFTGAAADVMNRITVAILKAIEDAWQEAKAISY